jgi:hypothetical protein
VRAEDNEDSAVCYSGTLNTATSAWSTETYVLSEQLTDILLFTACVHESEPNFQLRYTHLLKHTLIKAIHVKVKVKAVPLHTYVGAGRSGYDLGTRWG